VPLSICLSAVHPNGSACIVCELTFSAALLSGVSDVRWSMRKPPFAQPFYTTSDCFLLITATIGSKWTARTRHVNSARSIGCRRSADVIWQAIALHTSPGIPIRLADEIALVHLGAGLDFLGFGLDQVPSRLVEELLEIYPRMNFKAEFRNLLIEHCRHNPAAQVLTWTDDVARTAGCTLHGQPIPTASQIMLAAPFGE
jgi:hypothetical protein